MAHHLRYNLFIKGTGVQSYHSEVARRFLHSGHKPIKKIVISKYKVKSADHEPLAKATAIRVRVVDVVVVQS